MHPPQHRPPGCHAIALPARRAGFTLLEVMLASLLLTAGVGALLGTAGLTIRMVVRGRQAARATQAATTQVEVLRGVAATPPAGCAGLSNGADSSADGMVRRWRIRSAGGLWEVTVVVSTPVAGGQFTDSLITSFRCP